MMKKGRAHNYNIWDVVSCCALWHRKRINWNFILCGHGRWVLGGGTLMVRGILLRFHLSSLSLLYLQFFLPPSVSFHPNGSPLLCVVFRAVHHVGWHNESVFFWIERSKHVYIASLRFLRIEMQGRKVFTQHGALKQIQLSGKKFPAYKYNSSAGVLILPSLQIQNCLQWKRGNTKVPVRKMFTY